jgi:hypothetical protein
MKTEEFIVWIDKDIDIDWVTNDYKKTRKSFEEQNQVLNDVARLECIPSDHHKENIRINYKRMLGEAIARSLEADDESAMKMLVKAEEYIKERNNEKSRYWYLTASGFTALIITFLGFVCWCMRMSIMNILGVTSFFLFLASSAGALGALFSIVQRLGKSNMNSAAGKSLHYLEGSFKIIAGCISALLIALAVDLGLFLPIFSKVDNTHLAMVLSGIIAGASERLAPSLISKAESTANRENTRPK